MGDFLSFNDLANQFGAKLQEIADNFNAIKDHPSLIKWIDKQFGKIIAFRLKDDENEQNYYLVITKDGARMNEGEYSAFEIMFTATPELMMNLLEGKIHISTELKARNLRVWGNLHEGIIFQRFSQKM